MNSAKKIQSQKSLLASIVLIDSCGVHNCLIGLDKEVWEVGSVLKQKQRELGHSSASYIILNSHASLLGSHLS